MRRYVAALTVLAIASVYLAAPGAGRTAPAPTSARDAVSDYVAGIYLPAVGGTAPSDAALRAFYEEHIAAQSRAQVGEDRFVAYWRDRAGHAGSVKATHYSVGDAVESEAHDQALAPVTVSITRKGLEDNPILSVIWGLLCLGAAFYGMSCSAGDSDNTQAGVVIYRAVKEGDTWKVVLPDGDVAGMRKITVRDTGTHFAPDARAAEGGITVRVLGVTLAPDAATLRLVIDNAAGVQAVLSNTAALATLTDEAGRTYGASILTSTMPAAVDAGASETGTLVFAPVPPSSAALLLTLPDIRAGDAVMALKVNIALAAPSPASYSPIPGEPALRYVLAVFLASRHVRFGPTREYLDDPSESKAGLAELYRTQLAGETRSEITERAFVEFTEKHAAAAWARRVGRGRWYPHIGFPVAVADPVYNDARDHASVDVTTTWGTAPGKTATDLRTFQVVKEGTAWRLVLPEDLFQAVGPAGPPAAATRRALNAAGSVEGITIRIQEISAEKDATILQAAVENNTDGDVNLFTTIAGATLTDEQGQSHGTRVLRSTLPDRVPPHSSIRGTLVFEPVPVDTKTLVLIVPDIRVADRRLSVSVDLVLQP
ncbi:MAG TPA: hypothetical protein VGX75_15075 [bacterium]|nr:hypothetical protein [bacterium]